MAEYTGWKPALTAALSKVGETIAVEQITLTAPLAYTLPTGTPSGVVHSVVFTQDNVGGHTVTYGGSPVSVDLTAGASTTVELHPVAGAYVVRYPATGPTSGSNTGDQDLSGLTVKSANLSDLTDAAMARTNLGLGDSATKAVGTTAGTVKAGDWKPAAVDVIDSTASGRALLTGADAKAQRASMSAQRAHMIDVRDYGAKGDGVADDTGAIQAAMTAAAGGSGVAYLPPGSYRVTSLTLSDGLEISGYGATLTKATPGRLLGGSGVDHLIISGVHLVGAATATRGVSIEGGSDIALKDVRVSGFTSRGLHIMNIERLAIGDSEVTGNGSDGGGDYGVIVSARNITISNLRSHANKGDGLTLYSDANSQTEGATVTGSHFYENTRHGFTGDATIAYPVMDLAISGCVSYRNSGGVIFGAGFNFKNMRRVVASALIAHTNREQGIVFQETEFFSLTGSLLYNNDSHGLRLQGDYQLPETAGTGCHHGTVAGNVIRGNGTGVTVPHGIAIGENTYDVSITGNTITGNDGHPIAFLYRAGYTDPYNIHMNDNIFQGNAWGDEVLYQSTLGEYRYYGNNVDRQRPNGALVAGQYYFATGQASTGTSAALGNGTLRLAPFVVPNQINIVSVGAEVTTAGETGSTIRCVIYGPDATGAFPGALLVDSGLMAAAAAGIKEQAVTSVRLQPGTYWAGVLVQSAPTTQPTLRTATSPPVIALRDDAAPAANATWYGYLAGNGITGAPPATIYATPSTSGAAPARVFFKTA